MKLPNFLAPLNKVTRLSKLLSFLTFFVFLVSAFYLGVNYQTSLTKLSQTQGSLVTPTDPPECQEYHFYLDTNPNAYDWKLDALIIDREVYYTETNTKLNLFCRHTIARVTENIANPPNPVLFPASENHKLAFVERKSTLGDYLVIFDLISRNRTAEIAIAEETPPNNYELIANQTDAIILVLPITFPPTGCQSDISCESLHRALEDDWANTTSFAYIVRSHGKFTKFPRNELPYAKSGYSTASITYQDGIFLVRNKQSSYNETQLIYNLPE